MGLNAFVPGKEKDIIWNERIMETICKRAVSAYWGDFDIMGIFELLSVCLVCR